MWSKSSLITISCLLMLAMDINSNMATLESNLKLEIRSNSSLPYVAEGVSVTLEFILLRGNISVENTDVIWISPNGREIRESPLSYKFAFTKISSFLIIINIIWYMGGDYTCKTRHKGHDLVATAKVYPVSGIQFSNKCEPDQYVVTNHNPKPIRCEPEVIIHDGWYDRSNDKRDPSDLSAFKVQIQWLKNYKPYLPPPGRCHVDHSIGIVCDPFVESDAGVYVIIARMTSPGEQTINRTIVVEVQTLPVIQNFPTEVSVVENATLQLTCRATGYPSPNYFEYFGHNHHLRRLIFDANSGALTLLDVSRNDAGFITCAAWNSAGGDYKKAKLVVTTAEGVPLEDDQEAIISLHDSLFHETCNSDDSDTATMDLIVIQLKVLLCFAVIFLCLLMLLFIFDFGVYLTRGRGAIALLSNYFEWGEP